MHLERRQGDKMQGITESQIEVDQSMTAPTAAGLMSKWWIQQYNAWGKQPGQDDQLFYLYNRMGQYSPERRIRVQR